MELLYALCLVVLLPSAFLCNGQALSVEVSCSNSDSSAADCSGSSKKFGVLSGTELERRFEEIFDGPKISDGLAQSSLPLGHSEILQNPGLVHNIGDSPGIWITISQKGLDYVKDVLVTQILQAEIPLHLPDMTKSASLAFVGEINASFTNVTLVRAEVHDSAITLGNAGIAVQGSRAIANLTLNWEFTYTTGWLPNPISDRGAADIRVRGMQAGASVNIRELGGALDLIILQCGTYIDDLEVQLNGGTSWLYQWLINEFEDHIRATVEDQLTAQLRMAIEELNFFLHGLQQLVPVDETSELNFTIVDQPIIRPTSLSIGVNGDFVSLMVESSLRRKSSRMPPGLVCSGDMKMVTIGLSELVLNSAAAVYYNAGLLNWLVEKVPDQAFLNTSKWKYLIPQLYQQYPNTEMKLNFTVSSCPTVAVTLDGMEGIATAHMIIEVINDSKIVQVACISVAISMNGLAGLNGNNITGQAHLRDLNLTLEWSNVGNIHLVLVKVLVRTLIKDLLLPLLNLSLRRGFPLPIVPSVEFVNGDVKYGDGFILVCTDVQYTG